MRYWRVHTLDNDGTDRSIPNDYTKNEKQSGLWWRNLVAGGIAGAVSRSCTAPLERTRIFLQVKGTGNQMSIFGTLSSMIKEGGVRSLWRGKTSYISISEDTNYIKLKTSLFNTPCYKFQACTGVK